MVDHKYFFFFFFFFKFTRASQKVALTVICTYSSDQLHSSRENAL